MLFFLAFVDFFTTDLYFNKRKTTTPKEKTRKKKKQETCPIFRILFLFLGVTFLFSLLQ
jgi:phosphate/sulfate permease